MRPEWTDAEKGEAAGIAHAAAFATVCPEPPEGWRNSYDATAGAVYTELAAAHLAAHEAMADYPEYPTIERSTAYLAAWQAIRRWGIAGRPISGYEAHVPRLSEASAANPSPSDNPRQRP